MSALSPVCSSGLLPQERAVETRQRPQINDLGGCLRRYSVSGCGLREQDASTGKAVCKSAEVAERHERIEQRSIDGNPRRAASEPLAGAGRDFGRAGLLVERNDDADVPGAGFAEQAVEGGFVFCGCRNDDRVGAE